jgi:hypothetical protein
MASTDLRLDGDGASLKDSGGELVNLAGSRGWLRRLAPDDWQGGVPPDGHEGIVRQAWSAAIVSLVSLARVEWLSSLTRILGAEDKLVQARACRELNLPTPPTVLVTRPQRIPLHFGHRLIVKPFAAGHFREETGDARVVYATPITRDDPRLELLSGAPFLIQPLLGAVAHRRICTVKGQAWVAELNADGLEADWRSIERAHSSFRTINDDRAAENALRLSRHLGVGYSCQDWLIGEDDQSYFLDLNPAGQWLFLPAASHITCAIADWLIGDGRDG